MEKLIVYTKFCLPCLMEDFWQQFQKEATKRKFEIKVIRTSYRPFSHRKAVEIWGSDDYSAFAVFPNGDALKLERIMDMWTDDVKNKMAKPGKKKSAENATKIIKVKAKKTQAANIEVERK